ncbi:large ribosomal subunit protein bL9m-like [Ylistrum balloti]|uniref:large ribosomal subunit protein bL9m-like n=1 Tax=Ylistrum balloti TaxID=509963 RepID=UPI002905C7C2|nr:large ribosomal subunit protein bL9m-like [Ylistrum balloti]
MMLRSLLQIAKVVNPLSIQPCPKCLQRLVPSSLSFQPVRTTYIVERVNEVPLHKKTRQPRLKTRHYIYKVTTDPQYFRLEKAKVILLKNVRHVGKPGEVLYVRQKLFYQKLYPSGFAVFATESNLELHNELIKNRQMKMKKSKEKSETIVRAELTANDLTGMRLPIAVSTATDTVVTASHVVVALWKAGIESNKNLITMPEEPVTGDDEFPISLTINDKYTAKFTGVIYRVGKDSDQLIPREFDGFLKRTSKTKDSKTVVKS